MSNSCGLHDLQSVFWLAMQHFSGWGGWVGCTKCSSVATYHFFTIQKSEIKEEESCIVSVHMNE
jgi:hypothetical protein